MKRRTFMIGAGTAAVGLGVLPFIVGGREEKMTPAAARHRNVPLRSLTGVEAQILDHLGEVLLPGAAEAGIVHFVDHHVSVPPAESLLMLRYLDVPPPYLDFYRGGLAGLDGHARASAGRGFADLPLDAATRLVGSIAQAPPAGWQGPPSPLLYFAARSDAVDVVYGTMEGFERLGIPYMAHIEPERPW